MTRQTIVKLIVAISFLLPIHALAQSTPTYGGTLRIAYVTTSPHIDVQLASQGPVTESAHYMFETLFDRNEDGALEGLLATGYESSDDGLVYTFFLREGVSFHDGTPFDAEAVKYNIERKIRLGLPTWDAVPWNTIEVVDDHTLRVTLTAPAPHIIRVLSAKTWSMYSPTHVESVGADGILSQGVGTGPFMQAEFQPNDYLRLVKNPNYWQAGLPYLDEVIFQVVPDANTRAALLEAGDVDVALGLPIPTIERLQRGGRFNVLSAVGSRQYYAVLNNYRGPTSDVMVRKAINHAVDKEGILRAVFRGIGGEVAEAPYLSPVVDGFFPAGHYEYDPVLAGQLLDQAGWALSSDGVRYKDGERLSLAFYTRRGSVPGDFETAELIQGMLREVGVDTRLEVIESASFIPAVTTDRESAQYDMALFTWSTATLDAEFVMTSGYHSDAAAPRLYNRAYYSNTAVDRLIEESRSIPNIEDRNAAYEAIIAMVFDDAPILQLFDSAEFAATSPKVQGVYFDPAYSNWPVKYGWKTP